MNETKEEGVQNIYECDDIQIIQRKTGMIFSLNRNGQYSENVAIVVNGEQPRAIYLMNSDGKTIDRFAWKCEWKAKTVDK